MFILLHSTFTVLSQILQYFSTEDKAQPLFYCISAVTMKDDILTAVADFGVSGLATPVNVAPVAPLPSRFDKKESTGTVRFTIKNVNHLDNLVDIGLLLTQQKQGCKNLCWIILHCVP